MISSENIVACICEGNSEKYIMSILLEKDKLIFSEDQLLDNQFFQGKYRNPEVFSAQYLTMDYKDPEIGLREVVVLVVKDDKRNYVIKKPYSDRVKSKYLVVTSPELEMLMIHASGLYDEYKNKYSRKNPSLFLADEWGKKRSIIKSEKFIRDFFEKNSLVDAIKQHSQKTKRVNQYMFLADFLKKDA